ncbi:N-acetylmuramoyl-L-alanine amidase [Flavilitoribacter nigricans]|uniref:N-acetylmuramoyl-L-alanine amidase n=1 Tax=Flavilitoribacter nigricans (strain ATCC 23147 / DSM 23189 / NBRC 102662 / NCIMB 1420 / SS-2) TaxID=1122177 RepID=A0A2D0NEB3_FLAN2|nr:N-acetylmuramoyl-L-alanine amidase [Flavilitoribacter nigricans]PHN06748.1 cell wall hydrolase [Flavilitoribacter nigricans DSM 23189 = NBRC 102662]
MMKTAHLLVLWMISWSVVHAEDAPYFEIKAQPGDGIYSILRRYDLDTYTCNFDQFYKLNNLKRNARLLAGKSYQLPIQVYRFNGKTIRSSIGIDDWNLAIAIQTYNEVMLEKAMRPTSFKKDRELWVPHHILNCPEADKEPAKPVAVEVDNPEETGAKGKRHFDIFGSKYAYTPLESNKLAGKVFYVVSGHGGPDPGAMAKRGKSYLCEDEYAYDVALRLCRNLISHGATAYMINRDPDDGIRSDRYLNCDEDEVLWGNIKMSYGHKTRLFQRSDAINALYEKHKAQGVVEQTAIMIHVDSRSQSERTDVYFYHYPGNASGKKVADALHSTMKAKYAKYRKGGYFHGTVSGRDLHMLRETQPLSVYVELANIHNPGDQQRILIERNRQLLADWLFEGLSK